MLLTTKLKFVKPIENAVWNFVPSAFNMSCAIWILMGIALVIRQFFKAGFRILNIVLCYLFIELFGKVKNLDKSDWERLAYKNNYWMYFDETCVVCYIIWGACVILLNIVLLRHNYITYGWKFTNRGNIWKRWFFKSSTALILIRLALFIRHLFHE